MNSRLGESVLYLHMAKITLGEFKAVYSILSLLVPFAVRGEVGILCIGLTIPI